jgi:hypothetical protein
MGNTDTERGTVTDRESKVLWGSRGLRIINEKL